MEPTAEAAAPTDTRPPSVETIDIEHLARMTLGERSLDHRRRWHRRKRRTAHERVDEHDEQRVRSHTPPVETPPQGRDARARRGV